MSVSVGLSLHLSFCLLLSLSLRFFASPCLCTSVFISLSLTPCLSLLSPLFPSPAVCVSPTASLSISLPLCLSLHLSLCVSLFLAISVLWVSINMGTPAGPRLTRVSVSLTSLYASMTHCMRHFLCASHCPSLCPLPHPAGHLHPETWSLWSSSLDGPAFSLHVFSNCHCLPANYGCWDTASWACSTPRSCHINSWVLATIQCCLKDNFMTFSFSFS